MQKQTLAVLAVAHLANQADAAALYWSAAACRAGTPDLDDRRWAALADAARLAARAFVRREQGWRAFCAAAGVADPDGLLAGYPGWDALRRARGQLPEAAFTDDEARAWLWAQPPGAVLKLDTAEGYEGQMHDWARRWERGEC